MNSTLWLPCAAKFLELCWKSPCALNTIQLQFNRIVSVRGASVAANEFFSWPGWMGVTCNCWPGIQFVAAGLIFTPEPSRRDLQRVSAGWLDSSFSYAASDQVMIHGQTWQHDGLFIFFIFFPCSGWNSGIVQLWMSKLRDPVAITLWTRPPWNAVYFVLTLWSATSEKQLVPDCCCGSSVVTVEVLLTLTACFYR